MYLEPPHSLGHNTQNTAEIKVTNGQAHAMFRLYKAIYTPRAPLRPLTGRHRYRRAQIHAERESARCPGQAHEISMSRSALVLFAHSFPRTQRTHRARLQHSEAVERLSSFSLTSPHALARRS
jgi:hypothetical protein